MYCYVRDCPNGLKSLKRKKDSDLVKFFSAPEDKNILEKWRRVVPKGENVLTPEDKLCDSHFLPSEVLWFTETKLSNGNVRRLLRDEPILRPGTIPSIFPAEKLEKENAILPGKEKQETPKPIVKSITSVVKEKSASSKSIVRNTNTVVNVKNETPKSNVRIRFKDPAESSGKRNPQRVKRRSTILDDYWTDDELNQVHNPGVSKTPSGSAKKRKTESSGLQPVIRLVPLECLMDKTVSKSKTPSKPIVANRPSTEEIDHELKKVIEIPLLTRLKPSKSMTIRSTKETVQFKPPRRNLSKTKMKILPLSETLVSHDVVTVSPSEGFNEVKTETPDIEEELARMEMEEENEDVKSSDIVIMNPPLGEDDSVVVKSEEEDDGYSINEVTENPIFTEGDEVPTIKSESEEEQPAVEVGSYNSSDNELAVKSHPVPESEAAAGSEQGPALPTDNSDNILTPHEQPNNVPEVPAEIEQNKNVEEHSTNETGVVEKSAAVEAEDDTSCNKGTEEGEVSKSSEEKSHEEEVLENKEKEETAESAKEDEAEIPTDAASKEVNTDSQEIEPERKSDEGAMETEASIEVEPKKQEGENVMEIEKETLLSENIEHITKPTENEEMSKLVEREEMPKSLESEEMPKSVESEEMLKSVESEEMPKPVECEEMSKPVECEEMSKPAECEEMSKSVESEEMPKPAESEEMPKTVESDEIPKAVESEEMPNPIESEVSQAADEEIKETADEKMKETADDGKDCGDTVVSEGSVATEMVCESEPSTTELENNLAGDKEILNEKQTMHGDEPRSDNVNPDLPEVGDKSVGIASETEKGVTVIDITANDGPSNPEDNVIDVSDSEGVETDKGPTSEDDGIINVDLSEGTDQSSNSEDVTVVNSPASQEAERPGRKDGESGMETEDGDDRTNAQSAENIVDDDDDDVHLDGTNKKSGSKQADQPDIDEMDIEAEVARLVSEVEETADVSPSKAVENEGRGGEDKEKHPDKESAPKEAIQPQEIVLQDTTNLGGITAAGVQNLFSAETIQEILKQIKLPLTTPVTFRIAPASNTPPSSSSSSGRGRGRRKGMRGMRGTNRHVVPRASSSNDTSHNSIDLFRHLTRTRTVFDFPTFVTDVDDDIQYWKLCQILKESFHELIETRNTKTSIGKLTLRVALNRPKKPKVQQNNGESETDP